MVVKFVKERQIVLSLLLIAISLKSGSCIQECKVDLLKYFGMAPLKYPVNSKMAVCGNITENCCSMSDEIRIYRLWKRFSVSQITKYIDKLVKNYITLFGYHEELLAVDFDKIEIKHSELRKIPFKFKVCERIALQLDGEEKILNSVDLLNNNELLDDPEFKRALIMKHTGKEGKGELSGNDIRIERLLKNVSGKAIKGRILESELNNEIGNFNRIPERELRVVLDNQDGKPIYSDIQQQKSELDKQLQESLSLQNNFKLSNNKYEDHNKTSDEPITDTNNITVSQINSNNLQRDLKQSQTPISSNSIKSSKTSPKPSTSKKTKKKRDLSQLTHNKFSRPFEFQEELPERKVQCIHLDRVVTKNITVVNKYKEGYCRDIRVKLKKFKIKDFRAYIPDVKVEMTRLMNLKKSFYCYLCDIEKQKMIDAKNSIVTFDAHFCRRLVIDFRDYLKFQNVLLIEYIDMILQYVRCFQTTADEARFPYASFLKMYQKNFEVIQKCYDNIDQPDFMNHCIFLCQQYSYTTFSKFFDGNPDLINRILMTLTSFFRKLRDGQALAVDYKTLQNEFDLIDAVDFNMNFDDLEAMDENHQNSERKLKTPNPKANSLKTHTKKAKTTNLKKLSLKTSDPKPQSSLKTHKRSKRGLETTKEYNPEASLIKSMSKEQYHNYMIEKTYNQATPISWEKESDEGHASIYETKSDRPVTRVFRSRFIDDFNALDPLEVEPQLNFDINIKTLFKMHCDMQRKKGEKPEILQREVIKEYFSANDDDIHNFATDLFMPFADYEFFHMKENAPSEKKVIL